MFLQEELAVAVQGRPWWGLPVSVATSATVDHAWYQESATPAQTGTLWMPIQPALVPREALSVGVDCVLVVI